MNRNLSVTNQFNDTQQHLIEQVFESTRILSRNDVNSILDEAIKNSDFDSIEIELLSIKSKFEKLSIGTINLIVGTF